MFPFNYVEVVAAASSAKAAAPNEEVGQITVTCCRVNLCVEFLASVFASTTCLFFFKPPVKSNHDVLKNEFLKKIYICEVGFLTIFGFIKRVAAIFRGRLALQKQFDWRCIHIVKI